MKRPARARRVQNAPLVAAVHRFGDSVAVYAASHPDSGTLYLTEGDARRYAAAILVAADSIAREPFVKSNVPQFTLNTDTKEPTP